MPVYKCSSTSRVIDIGDELYAEINGEETDTRVIVLSIVKVDLGEKIIWFTGVPVKDLV